jgi:hypothetical protein
MLPATSAGWLAPQETHGGGFTGMFREDGGYDKESIYLVQGVGWAEEALAFIWSENCAKRSVKVHLWWTSSLTQ